MQMNLYTCTTCFHFSSFSLPPDIENITEIKQITFHKENWNAEITHSVRPSASLKKRPADRKLPVAFQSAQTCTMQCTNNYIMLYKLAFTVDEIKKYLKASDANHMKTDCVSLLLKSKNADLEAAFW